MILNPERLSQEEINRILSDHAFNMQALRKKQDAEKEKLKQILEWKKRDRLLRRRADKQDQEDEEERKANAAEGSSSSGGGSRKNSSSMAGSSASLRGGKPVGIATPLVASHQQEQASGPSKPGVTKGGMEPTDSLSEDDEDSAIDSDDDLQV